MPEKLPKDLTHRPHGRRNDPRGCEPGLHRVAETFYKGKATGCVNPAHCEPSTHTRYLSVELCYCGMARFVNNSVGRAEYGPWDEPVHEHTVKNAGTYDWPPVGCVLWNPRKTGTEDTTCNPAAHGGVARVQTCRCGMKRWVNMNGDQRENGHWYL